jgi:sigma-E factor negative regulatory protein RseA
MEKMDNQELISALADGQLQGDALARGVAAASDAAGHETWRSYHLIGEVLRTGHATPGTPSEVFLARMRDRLQQEPAVAPVVRAPVHTDRPAANDWLWKLVAGVASFAAVAAVGWNMWGTAGSGQPQLAAAPAAVVPVAGTATMIRDPRLDQLLAAHRQFGGAGALQTPSGFLRNATFEGPAR